MVTEEVWQVKMSNFTVTFDKKKISLKFLPVTGNAEKWHGCQFSNVTTDMHINKMVCHKKTSVSVETNCKGVKWWRRKFDRWRCQISPLPLTRKKSHWSFYLSLVTQKSDISVSFQTWRWKIITILSVLKRMFKSSTYPHTPAG